MPSVGPPPPGLRRPHVPEDLKPKIAEPAEASSRGSYNGVSSSQHNAPKFAARPQQERPQGNNSAVAVQVLEGRQKAEPKSNQIEVKTADEAPPKKAETIKLSGELSDEDKAYVRELRARDREVRAHEAAHASAGSGYTSQPNFEYVTGPDGVQYAVGGHVQIDTSGVPDDPKATITKMEVVRRAALAPARPSGQDRSVAASAEQSIRQAEAALQEQKAVEKEAQQAEASGSSQSFDARSDDSGLVIPISDQGNDPKAESSATFGVDLIA